MTATPVAQSKLTPEVIDAVAESLRVNANWLAAADYAGITDRSLRTYRERAQAHQTRLDNTNEPSEVSALEAHPDHPYWQAAQRWDIARSRGELELVATIRKVAIAGDWRAADSLLKKGWPDRYSDRVELTGAGGGPVQISTDELRASIEESLTQIAAKREAAGEDTTSADVSPAGNDPQA